MTSLLTHLIVWLTEATKFQRGGIWSRRTRPISDELRGSHRKDMKTTRRRCASSRGPSSRVSVKIPLRVKTVFFSSHLLPVDHKYHTTTRYTIRHHAISFATRIKDCCSSFGDSRRCPRLCQGNQVWHRRSCGHAQGSRSFGGCCSGKESGLKIPYFLESTFEMILQKWNLELYLFMLIEYKIARLNDWSKNSCRRTDFVLSYHIIMNEMCL